LWPISRHYPGIAWRGGGALPLCKPIRFFTCLCKNILSKV